MPFFFRKQCNISDFTNGLLVEIPLMNLDSNILDIKKNWRTVVNPFPLACNFLLEVPEVHPWLAVRSLSSPWGIGLNVFIQRWLRLKIVYTLYLFCFSAKNVFYTLGWLPTTERGHLGSRVQQMTITDIHRRISTTLVLSPDQKNFTQRLLAVSAGNSEMTIRTTCQRPSFTILSNGHLWLRK